MRRRRPAINRESMQSVGSTGDANNGWFQTVEPDLYFIKTKNTGSGRVEIHSATAASGYQGGIHVATAFSTGDADNGWFQIAGGDLVFIKTKNTGSGRVEFFRASAGSGFGQVVTATATAFSPGDANNGWFSAEDVNADGNADLIFVKTHNPGSGHVEFFVADGSRSYQQVTSANPT